MDTARRSSQSAEDRVDIAPLVEELLNAERERVHLIQDLILCRGERPAGVLLEPPTVGRRGREVLDRLGRDPTVLLVDGDVAEAKGVEFVTAKRPVHPTNSRATSRVPRIPAG
jgi:hypothetical protein